MRPRLSTIRIERKEVFNNYNQSYHFHLPHGEICDMDGKKAANAFLSERIHTRYESTLHYDHSSRVIGPSMAASRGSQMTRNVHVDKGRPLRAPES